LVTFFCCRKKVTGCRATPDGLELKTQKTHKTTNQSKHQIKSTPKPSIKKPMISTIGFK
jgi:hypothetical protein